MLDKISVKLFVLLYFIVSATRRRRDIGISLRLSVPVRNKGALSCLRQFLATKSALKLIKNAFYFTLKALFVLKIFKFLS